MSCVIRKCKHRTENKEKRNVHISLHKHACMLEVEPQPPRLHPLSSGWRRMLHGGKCFLPASWHYVSKLLLSQKGLQLERERQVNSGYYFLIHPYSSFRFYWDFYIMLVFMASLLYVPFLVFIPCSQSCDPFILFSDAMGFLYIFLNFFTGTVHEHGKNVNFERAYIAKRYLKDTFFVDLLSALPLQTLFDNHDCRFPVHTIMFIFKLFRVIVCGRVWKSLARQFGITYIWSTPIITILRAIIFFHWMTFVHHQVPIMCAQFYKHEGIFLEWLHRTKVVGIDLKDVNPLDTYVTNMYLVICLCLGNGVFEYHDGKPPLRAELVLTATLCFVGLIFIVYLMTNLLRLVIYRKYETYVYNGQLKELHNYLKAKHVPERLCQKIKLYINYRFNGHYFNQSSILTTLNVQIKQEINMHFCKQLVVNVPLFRELPIALINTIIFSLTQVLYMPGEVIVRYGQPGSSIYLISSGTVAVMDAEGKEVGHLKDGAFFGERALLKPGTLRSATIIALEITEIYKLNHAQFRAALQPCPRLKRRLLNAADNMAPTDPGPPAPPAPPAPPTLPEPPAPPTSRAPSAENQD